MSLWSPCGQKRASKDSPSFIDIFRHGHERSESLAAVGAIASPVMSQVPVWRGSLQSTRMPRDDGDISWQPC